MMGMLKRSQGIVVLFLMAMALGMAGCAASGGEGGTRRDPNLLTSDEMAQTSSANLYDVIEQLRPRWFQVRSVTSLQGQNQQIGVFVNRVYQGGLDTLRGMPKSGVAQVRYLDGPTASAQLRTPGATALAGAIVVETVAPDR